jgi:hypothetical protein
MAEIQEKSKTYFHLRPRVGDVWKIKRKGKWVTKIVGEVRMIRYDDNTRGPYVEWKRQPKGRYSGYRPKWLMKSGILVKRLSA